MGQLLLDTNGSISSTTIGSTSAWSVILWGCCTVKDSGDATTVGPPISAFLSSAIGPCRRPVCGEMGRQSHGYQGSGDAIQQNQQSNPSICLDAACKAPETGPDLSFSRHNFATYSQALNSPHYKTLKANLYLQCTRHMFRSWGTRKSKACSQLGLGAIAPFQISGLFLAETLAFSHSHRGERRELSSSLRRKHRRPKAGCTSCWAIKQVNPPIAPC
jgi:hypothetical protein